MGNTGRYSLVLNPAHAAIAIRSKRQISVAGMPVARPQALGVQLLLHHAAISFLAIWLSQPLV